MNKDKLIKLGLEKINGDNNFTWAEIADICGITNGEVARQYIKRYRKENGLLPGKYEKDKKHILHISDLHYPFNLEKEICKEYVGKIDFLVLNGDLLDCQSISKYIKKYRIDFVDEMIGAREMLIDFIKYIKPKKVYLNYGNHEQRMIKYFSERLHEDILQLLPETALDFICVLGFWRHDKKNKTRTFYEPLKKVFEGKVDIVYTGEWHCRIGNTIFCHSSAYKKNILKTAEDAYLYFLQNGQQLFDCLVMAHTHHWGLEKYGNTYLIESGAFCKEQDYVDGKLVKPQVNGFVYIVQDKDGNFIYDESKLEII